MLSRETGDRIDSLVPTDQRWKYPYAWWPLMGGPCWYLAGLTPIGWESMLDSLDRLGVDTTQIRAAIESELARGEVGAGI